MQISWVTPSLFNAEKLSLQPVTSADSYERFKILYQYNDSPASIKDLVITVPRLPDAYVTCRGVQKDFFSRGDNRIETNRYGAQFTLSSDNEYHIALYKTFEKVIKTIEDLTGTNVTFPAKDMENYSIIYTNLIHANDGRMFSLAYTADEQLNILDVKQSIVRPAFLLSTLKKSATETKIRIQISQMFVYKEIMNCNLAHRD